MNWLQRIFGKKRGKPASQERIDKNLGGTGIEDRSIGCLLGLTCGDILGANIEKVSRAEILKWHGRVTDFIGSAGRPLGYYTDDTELALALASSLVNMERIDGAHCAATYAEFFKRAPARGYGRTTKQILEAIHDGADYRFTGRMLDPSGSYTNGGAMRIAPVGIAFRNAADAVLFEAVKIALTPTHHDHPEGIDGGWIQAKIVGWLVKIEPKLFDRKVFLTWLRDIAKTKVMRCKIVTLERAFHESWSTEQLLQKTCTKDEQGRIFQSHAAEAIVCALWSFIRNYLEPEECIIQAVCMGGDSDTIGALAGAQAGALHGTSWIPSRWFDHIENQPETGRDVIVEVARLLSRLDLRKIDETPWPPKRSAIIRRSPLKA